MSSPPAILLFDLDSITRGLLPEEMLALALDTFLLLTPPPSSLAAAAAAAAPPSSTLRVVETDCFVDLLCLLPFVLAPPPPTF